MKAQSMYHRHIKLVVEGFPEEASIADTSDLDFGISSSSLPPPIPERVSTIPPPNNSWFKRKLDGKLFRSIRSAFARVELESENGGEYDVATPHLDGWKSISPTSTHTYCRMPPIR